MKSPRETADQLAQQHFGHGKAKEKESDAMKEIRLRREREVAKTARLRALRLAKEEADRAAAAAAPKKARRTKAQG